MKLNQFMGVKAGFVVTYVLTGLLCAWATERLGVFCWEYMWPL